MAARARQGSAFTDKRTGKHFAVISLGGGKRKGVLCPTAPSLQDA